MDSTRTVQGVEPPTRETKSRCAAFVIKLFQPVDVSSLVVYRISFGLIMLWEVYRYFDRGWIRHYYIEPEFMFKYFGFSWVTPWPGEWMYVHFLVVACAAIGVAFGIFYRLSAVVLFITFTHWFLLCESVYLNHLYLVSLLSFLGIFLPVHHTATIDSHLRPSRRTDFAPQWALWLIRGQIGLVYFFGGIAKLNGDWLRTQPMRMWMEKRDDWELFHGLVPVGELLTWEPTILFLTYGGLVFDLSAPFLLLWKRTRIAALLAVIAFHLTNAWMFSIGIFPWFMIAGTLIFLRPDWPRLVFNWPRREGHPDPDAFRPAPLRRTLVMCGLAVWFAIQILMPLRHLLYPGNVHWTEEGHRFAWHMKLRSKSGSATFHVEDPTTDFSAIVRLDDYLSERQRRKLPTHPDMIVQFANYIARVYREDYGLEHVVVRAEVQASLNGRERQWLVDDRVNLAAQERTLTRMEWIVPFEDTPLPGPK